MGNILCLLIGVLIPIVVLGWALRRGLRPLSAASAYRNVAWRLGMEADTRGVSLQGYLDRRRLFVGEIVSAGERGAVTKIRAVLDFAVPLGVGLVVRHRSQRFRRFRRSKPPSLATGDPTFDDHLELRAFDPDRALALLTDPVRQALAQLIDRWPDVELTDHWVFVRLRSHPRNQPELLELVQAMLALAEALEAARHHLPAHPVLAEQIGPWRAIADTLSLQVDPTLQTIEGTWGGRTLRITFLRRDEGFVVDVQLAFRDHRPLGLHVSPTRDPDGYWQIGQDIQVGEPAFDDAFVIKGHDPGAIRERLTGPAMRELLGLLALGPLRVNDQGIELFDVPVDAVDPLGALERARRFADALGW